MKRTYIIAEIGQNHNGDMELAKKLIDMIAMPIYDGFSGCMLPPVDAVKFTKRDLSEELTTEEYNRPYDSPNSFGTTYGEHREKLEFSYDQYIELEKYARSKKLDFIVTLCSPKTLKLLDHIKIDRIKVASRDLTNIPLLEKIAETGLPVIFSTGMSDRREIEEALKLFSQYHDRITILHCLSQYPAEYKNINLRTIQTLIELYGDKYEIGYSDHSIGITVPALAVALGAKVIEKHVTLGRTMKGADHAGSLEADGLWRMTRDIRNTELALGDCQIEINEVVKESMKKLRRSLAIKQELKKGKVLTEDLLIMLSPGTGLRWQQRTKLISKKAKQVISENSLLSEDMFEE
jgi:sialic acid synthase